MKIIVTGCRGQLGTEILKQLREGRSGFFRILYCSSSHFFLSPADIVDTAKLVVLILLTVALLDLQSLCLLVRQDRVSLDGAFCLCQVRWHTPSPGLVVRLCKDIASFFFLLLVEGYFFFFHIFFCIPFSRCATAGILYPILICGLRWL